MLKQTFLGTLLLLSCFTVMGQIQLAVVNQDSVDVFIEDVFFDNNEVYHSIVSLGDSLFLKNVAFLKTQYIWVAKRQEGGCLSVEQSNKMVKYIQFLEHEIVSTKTDIETTIGDIKNNAHLILQNHIQQFFEDTATAQDLSFILNANQLYFKKENITDLTSILLRNLNQNKTILSQKMYSKELAIPLILEINNNLKLVDYPTFKENDESQESNQSQPSN